MIRNKKLFVIFLLIVFITTLNFLAYATDISGVIVDDTLKVADSPFTVTGNISVPSWHNLTVDPGVIFKFNVGLSFTIAGTLNAIGAVQDSIRFTSNDPQPQSGDWNGIIFESTSQGALKYTIVEFASEGITASNASPTIEKSFFDSNNNSIDCTNSATPLIRSNHFQNNANSAIRCTDSSPTISKNFIQNNVAVSSTILCEASSPRITENLIRDNNNEGIECLRGSKPEVWQNTIVQCLFGITSSDSSSPSIRNNIIAYNSQIGIAFNAGSTLQTIQYNNLWSNTAGNYFGTPADVGDLSRENANGDSTDIHFNLNIEPLFMNINNDDFQLQFASPCIDAGDPTNPAGISFLGIAPEVGAFELNGSVPVELVSFVFSENVLRWTTASETNNFGFEVQRSNFEESGFEAIAFVPGSGTTSIPQQYEFRDSVTAGFFFYRLKQIDTDGSFEFSQIIKANYSSPNDFTLFQNYPNPFNPSTSISFQIPESLDSNTETKLTIFNAVGQEVLVLLDEAKNPGFYQLQWNGDDKLGRGVASGIYLYTLQIGDKALSRRMLLVR